MILLYARLKMSSKTQKQNFLVFRDCLTEYIQSHLSEPETATPETGRRKKKASKQSIKRKKGLTCTEASQNNQVNGNEAADRDIFDMNAPWRDSTVFQADQPTFSNCADPTAGNDAQASVDDTAEFIDASSYFYYILSLPAAINSHPLHPPLNTGKR
jgi:hypothetical protein